LKISDEVMKFDDLPVGLLGRFGGLA